MNNTKPITHVKIAGFVIACCVILGIAIYWIVYGIMSLTPQENTERTYKAVYSVCDYSRRINDRTAEQLCGRVQNATNTEFMCNKQGNCWVEELGR